MTAGFDKPRGTWYFVVDVSTLSGKRRQVKRRGFATKKAALAAERGVLDEHADGRHEAPARLTFGAYLTERWLPQLDADPRLKPTTKASYRASVRHLVEHAGPVPLAELGGEHLDSVQRSLADRSLSLRHAVHVSASKSLRQAVKWRLIPRNPVDDATPPPQPTTTPTSWTPDEVVRFLAVAADDRWWPLWRLPPSPEPDAASWSD